MTYSEFLAEWNKPDGKYKDIREGGFPVLKEKAGIVSMSFERLYGIPLATVKKWLLNQESNGYRKPPEWVLPMMAYCILVNDADKLRSDKR